jgi:hypothetical protein
MNRKRAAVFLGLSLVAAVGILWIFISKTTGRSLLVKFVNDTEFVENSEMMASTEQKGTYELQDSTIVLKF